MTIDIALLLVVLIVVVVCMYCNLYCSSSNCGSSGRTTGIYNIVVYNINIVVMVVLH